MPHTVVVLGISGVGKSHLAGAIVEHDERFVHVQASELLKIAVAARSAAPVDSEALRGGAVVDNQALLLEAFAALRATEMRHVLFDGHNIIDTPGGLVEISPAVFECLASAGFVFVQDDPELVAARRANDRSRSRPTRSAAELEAHQSRAESLASEVAMRLSVPMARVRSGDGPIFGEIVQSMCAEGAERARPGPDKRIVQTYGRAPGTRG